MYNISPKISSLASWEAGSWAGSCPILKQIQLWLPCVCQEGRPLLLWMVLQILKSEGKELEQNRGNDHNRKNQRRQ